jgi:hypothetical protein
MAQTKPQTKLRMRMIVAFQKMPDELFSPTDFKNMVRTPDATKKSQSLNNCFASMKSSGWIRKVGRGQYKITPKGKKVGFAAPKKAGPRMGGFHASL